MARFAAAFSMDYQSRGAAARAISETARIERRMVQSNQRMGRAAGVASQSFGRLGGSAGGAFATIAGGAGPIGITTTALVGLGIASTNAFIKNNRSIREANSLFKGFNADTRAEITQTSRTLGVDYHRSIQDVVGAYTVAGGAGLKFANSQEFVAKSTRFATANFAEIQPASQFAIQSLNAFNLETKDLDKALNSLTIAFDEGIYENFEDFAQILDKVGVPAKQLGVTLEETTAAISIMTQAGFTAPTASTALARLFTELDRPMGRIAKRFEELSGTTFRKFLEAGNSLTDGITLMADAALKGDQSFNEFFGGPVRVRATRALGTLADRVEDVNELVGDMNSGIDTIGPRVEEALGGAQGGFSLLKAEIGETADQIGGKAADGISLLFGFNALEEKMKRMQREKLLGEDGPFSKLADEIEEAKSELELLKGVLDSITLPGGGDASTVWGALLGPLLSRGAEEGWRAEERGNIGRVLEGALGRVTGAGAYGAASQDWRRLEFLLEEELGGIDIGKGMMDAIKESLRGAVDVVVNDPDWQRLPRDMQQEILDSPVSEMPDAFREGLASVLEDEKRIEEEKVLIRNRAQRYGLSLAGAFVRYLVPDVEKSGAGAVSPYGFGGSLRATPSIGNLEALGGYDTAKVVERMARGPGGIWYDRPTATKTKTGAKKADPIADFFESSAEQAVAYANLNRLLPEYKERLCEMDSETERLVTQAAELGLGWDMLDLTTQQLILDLDAAGDAAAAEAEAKKIAEKAVEANARAEAEVVKRLAAETKRLEEAEKAAAKAARDKAAADDAAKVAVDAFAASLGGALALLGGPGVEIDPVTGLAVSSPTAPNQGRIDALKTGQQQFAAEVDKIFEDVLTGAISRDDALKHIQQMEGFGHIRNLGQFGRETDAQYRQFNTQIAAEEGKAERSLRLQAQFAATQERYAEEDHAFALAQTNLPSLPGLAANATAEEKAAHEARRIAAGNQNIALLRGRRTTLEGRLEFARTTATKEDDRRLELAIANIGNQIQKAIEDNKAEVQINDDSPFTVDGILSGIDAVRLGRGVGRCS